MLSLCSSHTGRDELWMRPSHLPLAISPRCLGSGGAHVQCMVGRAPTQPKGPPRSPGVVAGTLQHLHRVGADTASHCLPLVGKFGEEQGEHPGSPGWHPQKHPSCPICLTNGEPPPGTLHSPASGKTNV